MNGCCSRIKAISTVKNFYKWIYGENPVRKLKMPCWQNLIFQLENFYFPTEKLFFSSWAVFIPVFGCIFVPFWFLFDYFLFIFTYQIKLWYR